MQPINLEAATILSPEAVAARRIAFVLAKVADRLGLPLGCGVDVLLQSAMEQPEKVTAGEYGVIYHFRSPEAQQ
jgi:hypothetical protein